MLQVNENYLKLPGSYLFSDIAKKVAALKAARPDAKIIRLGIGDVTLPLPKACIEALQKAVAEMGTVEGFRGYGPEQGYDFLREAIVKGDFISRGIDISADEIFVSDGAKSDCGNIGDILGATCKVAVPDPVYPVYVDTNVMAGRAGDLGADGRWDNLVYLPCTEANNFVPALPETPVDVIYLCYPNNPTGTTLTRDQLKVWVDYARKVGALILFDAAYEAYITEENVPHSIYELEGAKECAIEFRSFSKTAGFTGTRCAYTIVPQNLVAKTSDGRTASFHKLWNRRQTTKFNGAPYIVQRAAEAVFTEQGRREVKANIASYLANAKTIRTALLDCGLKVWGGVNSPYVWVKTPGKMTSWEFFDHLLNDLLVVGTPGAGFGPSGEGYFRLTGFGSPDQTQEACER
ncbi:MAG: LL-diaminopimelate aminotransferase, partial [Oscillospiraceae bacterium]|nr:LL-diaminopimelate aminotransferase [Oscillospiraceae bacterium]